MNRRPTTPGYDPLPLLQTSIRFTQIVQKGTALSFAAFLVVHISAPLAAIVGGEASASGFALIGREYIYRGLPEVVLVFGSGIAHVLSGIVGRVLKRVERGVRRTRRRAELRESLDRAAAEDDELPSIKERTVSQIQRDDLDDLLAGSDEPLPATEGLPAPSLSPPFTLHHLTGYLLIPFIYHHAQLHRFIPMKENLTPFFSYSFVTHSLNSSHRYLSAVSYAAVGTLAAYHGITGLRLIWDPTNPRGLGRRRSDRSSAPSSWQVAFVGLVAGVGLGVVRIAMSPRAPDWMGRKYDTVLRRGFSILK